MVDIIKNIKKLGFDISNPTLPIANYSPFIISNKLIFISGQVPFKNNVILFRGKIGKDLDLDSGIKAAELCFINTLSILNFALDGNLNKVKRCLKLGVYVNSTDNFYEQPMIADGASNLLRKIFEENGGHTRIAVSTNSLPKNASVEIDSVFEF